ncbi:hypothetical protein [Halobacillus dabanensis]|nr:hypothetical protein [Halobacillus dabanensis]
MAEQNNVATVASSCLVNQYTVWIVYHAIVISLRVGCQAPKKDVTPKG